MPLLGGSEIDSMLEDLALLGGTVNVTLGATTVKGLKDHEAIEVLGDDDMPGVIASDHSVHVRTGVLSGLVSGASIMVGGVSYVVLKVLPYGDGEMTRIVLRTS